MDSLEQMSAQVEQERDLSPELASHAAKLLAEPNIKVATKHRFLLGLAKKGESVAEVAAFATTFRAFAVNPGVEAWADRAIDVCGTGGDGAGTFNISTAVSFIIAASGVPVFKHGNRSITSKCGSADLLEAVGIRLDASHPMIRESLESLNYCFFFAPAYHPAFKEIMPVRKKMAEAGQRSVFNLLGPLINPGRPAHQLMGVFSKDWVKPLAGALQTIGLKSGMVVHGEPEPNVALDELSCAGTNYAQGFGLLKDFDGVIDLDSLGLTHCQLSELKGGEVADNITILKALLSGRSNGIASGLRNTVLLNAGIALWIAGHSTSMHTGVNDARTCLESGQVADWLERARQFYQS